MVIDLAAGGLPFELTCQTADVVIIGSGPVGLAIGQELADASMRVVIAECGGRSRAADDRDPCESVGEPRDESVNVRQVRAFGGTSNVWSGRCAPLNPIDLETREWVPFSGWPLDEAAIAPYLDRAAGSLGLQAYPYDGTLLRRIGVRDRVASGKLAAQFWQYSQDKHDPADFARPGPQFLAHPPRNTTVLLNATATRAVVGADNSVAAVEIAAPDGARYKMRCRRVILCAGGLENARLLLLSWRARPEAPPPSEANTGRFLMDHPRATVGVFPGSDIGRLSDLFGLLKIGRGRARRSFTRGVTLSPQEQRRARLLNCAAWITELRSADDPWTALKNLVHGPRRRPVDAAAIIRHAPFVMRQAAHLFSPKHAVLHKCDALHLDALVEQVPDPNSRLTLSTRRDRFGCPVSRIDWRISDLERTTLLRFSDSIMSELKRLGLPAPRLAAGFVSGDAAGIALRDVAHPMGVTRMARDAGAGVVDENCRVHGVTGLYVAGSSVFPTGGHANPTLMAVALAIRLADHLKVTPSR